MYIRRLEIKFILLVCLITSSIMIFFIKEACNTYVQASSLFMEDGQTKLVMISMDYIDMNDIAKDEYLKDLFNKSYSAFVSSRQNGKASLSKVKLSIGSEKRLLLSNNLVGAAKMNDIQKSGNGYVIYKNMQELLEENKNDEFVRSIGYLGDKLHEIGRTTCILGNSDTDIENKSNILIAMDSKGVVDNGDVDNAIIYDESFPGGKRTDFDKLMEQYKSSLPASDFIIIDTGDLARIEYYRSKLTADEYHSRRTQAIRRISDFVRETVSYGGSKADYILISAYPSQDSIKEGDRLTPMISYTGNDAGLLYSKSTRREGIITSFDIADYVLEKIGGQEKSQLQEIAEKEPLYKMQNLRQRLLNVSVMRLPVLTWYAILEIICALMGLTYVLYIGLNKNKGLLGFVKTTLLVNIIAPVVFLYLSALDIESPYLFFMLFILSGYGIAQIINLAFKDSMSKFAAAALIVNLSLAIDLVRNSILIKSSVFGYDPIIGARFYGIGNEFAGVYLGSAILAAGCLMQRFLVHEGKRNKPIRFILLLYFALQIYIIAMPTVGANFGATIAVVCGCFFFFYSSLGKQIKAKQLLFLTVIIGLVISAVILVDMNNLNNTSHIGRFIADIRENGLKVLTSTIGRKLEMNIRLIRYTIWTKVLLCIILIITIMFFKPVRLLHGIFRKYKYLTAAWLGISAGSIAGLVVNDSGIVMAATAMIFTGYTILYICLEELETESSRGIKWTTDT